MAKRQRIVRIRRDYNQWVANETMEDYALRFTAKSARRWSAWRVANTALGAISFLALEAIGGTITVDYGFANAVAAIICASVLIFATGLPIALFAARYGVDIDLLTRGAGFGYIGSTITSLIYASFTFIFFAIEAAILASMLRACFGLPLWIGYGVCAVIVIPLVMHGITFISRLQMWTQPVWFAFNLLPFAFILGHGLEPLREWTGYRGSSGAGFDPLVFGAAASVVFSLVVQIGEQVDFLRFLPLRSSRTSGLTWWSALLAAGPGWIMFGAPKLLAGSFLAYLALRSGLSAGDAAQPTQMYRVAFGYVLASPMAALVLASAFVALSQIKINVTNAYAGSIAWSNFFSRLTHSHPGRVVWVVFNIAIALLLMELGVYETIEHTLAMFADIAASWVGALVADLVINKTLGLSPPGIEFKRAHLYDINPVGVGAMLLAAMASLACYFGLFGALAQAFSPFVALAVAFAAAPLIAWATKGRFYLARKPRAGWGRQGQITCVVCEHAFDPEDSAYCPVYAGAICSLCCSLDARCQDGCKPHARYSSQLMAPLRALLPSFLVAGLTSRMGRFCTVLALLAAVAGTTLLAIYAQIPTEAAGAPAMAPAFVRAFFALLAVCGVVAWLLVLGHESREAAHEETLRQTGLLMSEIAAHGRTDAALQKAREVAEAANLAKSRYVTGISHELRTPLNAILGYAQLLERDADIPEHRRDGIRIIRRSGEHLAALIEGLLDISKIEAGRIELHRDRVRLPEFLDQVVDMFQLQARAKALGFSFTHEGRLPAVVRTDERRLRQILINLLSNAIKFTPRGQVSLRVRWRDEIAEFEVEDTGIGIAPQDLERVFEPFQRVENSRAPFEAGVGLGLTITRLLTQIMGGEILIDSEPGRGSRFRVRLMLSEAQSAGRALAAEPQAQGYAGAPRRVMVCDDDPVHRGLMEDLLLPLGFIVLSTADGPECLRAAARDRPDLFLLDVAMPGMSGWELAAELRRHGFGECPIIMVSANANELTQALLGPESHDDVLAKPISLAVLLEKIGRLLALRWVPPPPETEARLFLPPPLPPATASPLSPHQIDGLRQLGLIGYVRGLRDQLTLLEQETPEAAAYLSSLRDLVAEFRLDAFMAALDEAP
jgi:signal transduction histidine kinase/purine-cytosine permease-like protein/DNA-binding NarL/FixJ family response regulator